MKISTCFIWALKSVDFVFGSSTKRPEQSTIAPAKTQIVAAAETQTVLSPVSNVKGAGFDRIVQIWLENTDYSMAAGDPNLLFLASQGITLTNYHAVTHPSQPNYVASVGGDNFGIDNDEFNSIPDNISTIADLLDTKGISWGEYEQDMPYAGFQGMDFPDQLTGANNYVRKHNPLVMYDSVTSNATRLSLMKNLTSFYHNLATETLPQWSFITPNMLDDGHDTSIRYAANWSLSFIEPLLKNSYFMNNALVILTFDENEDYNTPNKVLSIALGGAIPASLHGTQDATWYNHYSLLSTVSVNWGLPSLGRWDCNANVFQTVANATGYKNQIVDMTGLYFNQSYPGPLSDARYNPLWSVPDISAKCASGMGVLGSVVSTWGGSDESLNYTNVYPYEAATTKNVRATSGATSSTISSPTAVATHSFGGRLLSGGSVALVMVAGLVTLLG